MRASFWLHVMSPPFEVNIPCKVQRSSPKIPFRMPSPLGVGRNERVQGHPCPQSPCGGTFLVGTLETPPLARVRSSSLSYPAVSFACQQHWRNPATSV